MKNKALPEKRKATVIFLLMASLLIALSAGMTAVVQAAPPRTVTPPPMSAGYELNAMEIKAVLLLNEDRKNAGLEPLKINLKLSKLAADFAADMNTRKFFSHTDPDGKDPFDRMAEIGIDFPNEGENIALSPDVETAQKMLMDSPLHRENLLNPKFTEIGIGVRPASRGGVYLVQDFVGT